MKWHVYRTFWTHHCQKHGFQTKHANLHFCVEQFTCRFPWKWDFWLRTFWQMILDKLFECMHSCTIWFLFFKAWMQENEMKKSPAKLYIMNFISHGHLAIHFFVFQSIRHIFVTQYLLFSSPPLTLNGNYCTMYIHG